MTFKVQSSGEFLSGPFDMALVFAAVLIVTLETSVAARALHPRDASDSAMAPLITASALAVPTPAPASAAAADTPSPVPTPASSGNPSIYRVVVALPPLR